MIYAVNLSKGGVNIPLIGSQYSDFEYMISPGCGELLLLVVIELLLLVSHPVGSQSSWDQQSSSGSWS